MNHLVFLPVLVPLITGAILILVKHTWTQRMISIASIATVLTVAFALLVAVWSDGIQVYRQGDWFPPSGITLVADLLSASMVLIASIVATITLIYTLSSLDEDRERFFFHPLFQFIFAGTNGILLTGDMFNLFVFVEVTLISSYGLVALGGTTRQLEATIKYVSINLVGSSLLVAAVGLLYGLVGTLNMADLSLKVASSPDQAIITPIAILFLIVLGVKAGLFALWFWLPGTYTVCPAGISAYLGGILTKLGVYGIIRLFTLIFIYDPGYIHNIILVMAGATMLFGVLGAAAQQEYRTILTWHITSQVGYMIMGLGMFTVMGVTGSIFFLINNIFVKTALFLSAGIAERLTGAQDINRMGGLLSRAPVSAFLFLAAALALSGMPPFSGFWGKLFLVRAGIETGGWMNGLVVGIALVVSFLTFYSMLKIWQKAYWGNPTEGTGTPTWGMLIPTLALVTITLWIGLYPKPISELSMRTAEQLMNPQAYVEAVLGQNASEGQAQ